MRNLAYWTLPLTGVLFLFALSRSYADIDVNDRDPMLNDAYALWQSEAAWSDPSASAKPDSILQVLNNCENNARYERDRVSCLDAAESSYNSLLDHVYRRVLATSDRDTQTALMDEQQKWLAFDGAESATQESWKYSENAGLPPTEEAAEGQHEIIGINKINHIRQRISELMLYSGEES